MRTIIYYDKNRIQDFMQVFERIKDCKSCKLHEKSFSLDSKIIIKDPIDDREVEFNNAQKAAFEEGFERVSYSFII